MKTKVRIVGCMIGLLLGVICPDVFGDLSVDLNSVECEAFDVNNTTYTLTTTGTPPVTAIDISITGGDGLAGLKVSPLNNGIWDVSNYSYVEFDAENLSDGQIFLLSRIYSWADANHSSYRRNSYGFALNEGEKRTLRVYYSYIIPGAIDLNSNMRKVFPGMDGIGNIWAERVFRLGFETVYPHLYAPNEAVNFRISNVKFTGPLKSVTAPICNENEFFPFIDSFGQYVHEDWDEKIDSVADLQTNLTTEATELNNVQRPVTWDQYGGWNNGPNLTGTGFFRVEKYQGKWYFVDPEGKLFFSHGVCSILKNSYADNLLIANADWFPTEYSSCSNVNFAVNNIISKYGVDYGDFDQTVHKRLLKWGLNTIGNWSDKSLTEITNYKTPYTYNVSLRSDYISYINDGNIKFYDVFDSSFSTEINHRLSGYYSWTLNDPWCIGYFINNELNFGEPRALAEATIGSPSTQTAKIELSSDLQEKYGTIQSLNQAWGTSYGTWEALLTSTTLPSGENFQEDMEIFNNKIISCYYKTCRDVIRANSSHLYLGSRFNSTTVRRPDIWSIAGQYCDVVTCNVYTGTIANFSPEGLPDVPVLIGEFNFGIKDRGVPGDSVVPSGVTQYERALAYFRYMQGAMQHPNIIGCHWFKFRDQPIIGRPSNGENFCIGLVDVVDTPYSELTAMMRFFGQNMYNYIKFTDYTISSYAGHQDVMPSQYEFLEEDRTIHMWGNNWKALAYPVTISENTVLEFDYKNTEMPEINAIGFDTDKTPSTSRHFYIYGEQVWSIYNKMDYSGKYSGDGWRHYIIPVGKYFTGSFQYITFVNDDDYLPLSNVYFRNIKIYDEPLAEDL